MVWVIRKWLGRLGYLCASVRALNVSFCESELQ